MQKSLNQWCRDNTSIAQRVGHSRIIIGNKGDNIPELWYLHDYSVAMLETANCGHSVKVTLVRRNPIDGSEAIHRKNIRNFLVGKTYDEIVRERMSFLARDVSGSQAFAVDCIDEYLMEIKAEMILDKKTLPYDASQVA